MHFHLFVRKYLGVELVDDRMNVSLNFQKTLQQFSKSSVNYFIGLQAQYKSSDRFSIPLILGSVTLIFLTILMSTKWYLLKESKVSFKTVGLGNFNDSFIYRKNSSMLRKMGVWRKLPGGSRISFSTGFNLSSLVPCPETSSITSHGDKVIPGVFINHR